jgi:hypothetical protein
VNVLDDQQPRTGSLSAEQQSGIQAKSLQAPLAPAPRRCIGDEASLWGSYYRHAPKVLAGDLLVNLATLERGRR